MALLVEKLHVQIWIRDRSAESTPPQILIRARSTSSSFLPDQDSTRKFLQRLSFL